MRTLLTLLVSCTFVAASAGAAPIATADAPRATAQQMATVAGTYRLDDGRRADLFVLNSQLYVRIGRTEKELVLAGDNRFASRDGSIAIQFGAGFDNEHIVLEHNRGPGQFDNIRLAANERPGRGGAD